MVTRRTERMVKRGLLIAGALILMTLAGGLAYSGSRVYSKMVDARVERVNAEAERDALKARTTELSASLKALSTERGVEEEIRTRYPLVKAGEVEFVIVDKERPVVDSAAPAGESVWDTMRQWLPW